MRSNLKLSLFLIRHGQTARNLTPDLISQNPEEPLNETGIEQSNKLANRFKKDNITFDYIYCSPYLRAQETAKIILKEQPKNTSFITIQELKEINQGSGKDRSRKEFYAEPGVQEYIDFVGSSFRFEGGENLFDVEYRAMSFLSKEITDNPFMRNDKHLNIAIVSHGMTIKSIVRNIMNSDHRMTWRIKTENTSISELLLKDGKWFVENINDISHLKE